MNQSRKKVEALVQIDNERVIVTELRFSPGSETGWHRHGYDYVIVPQTTGQLRMADAGGERVAALTAGDAYYRPAGVEHNVMNDNNHAFVLIEIELKNS